MEKAIVEEVRRRAGGVCEYCRLPQAGHESPFQIDHIIARQHRGGDELDNLALACFNCNTYKGPNIASLDPSSHQIVRLFNPRRDQWSDHFTYYGALAVGRTPIGQATINVLNINHPDAVAIREALIAEGAFLSTVE
jgi:hypothetical protein